MKTTRITQTIDESGIASLLLDKPESSANVLDQVFFDEFHQHLDAIEADAKIKGVVIHSAKPTIFIAGADLTAFSKDLSEENLSHLIKMGQNAFNRLSQIKATTVAAIHGVCLGGGFELALACDYRIASRHKSTKLALPEVMLGILPAWGGSTRLPRMIGLVKAMQIILTGKQLATAKARKLGILHDLAHPENLVTVAHKWATRKAPRKHKKFTLQNSAPVASLLRHKVTRDTMAKTLGNYPALLMAIEVMTDGLRGSLEQSLEKEHSTFLKLMKTDSTQNLIRIFFLQERSKKCKAVSVSGDALEPASIEKVAVLGAGVMGAGIAQWVSARGYPVILKDISRQQLAQGMATASKLFNDGAKRKLFSKLEAQQGMDRITPLSDDVPMSQVDLVIEAVVEKLDLKRTVFKQLEARTGKHTILASNTSALSLTDIAEGMPGKDRLVGIHFFNPVHRMKLVEVIRGKHTSDATLTTALQFVKKIGKLPIIVQDSPGFLVNRILMPYLMEAVRLYDEGCSIERLDKLMLKFGMPMGPMRLIDEVGLDVAQHVATDLTHRLEHLTNESETLSKMIEHEWLGKKAKLGFYDYSDKSKKSVINEALTPLFPARPESNLDDKTIVNRMVLAMVNESARCIEEDVISAPEDVDFGMIMGTGWAPFRGGPLRYADQTGLPKIVEEMEALVKSGATHFKPANILKQLAQENKEFYSVTEKPIQQPKRRRAPRRKKATTPTITA